MEAARDAPAPRSTPLRNARLPAVQAQQRMGPRFDDGDDDDFQAPPGGNVGVSDDSDEDLEQASRAFRQGVAAAQEQQRSALVRRQVPRASSATSVVDLADVAALAAQARDGASVSRVAVHVRCASPGATCAA